MLSLQPSLCCVSDILFLDMEKEVEQLTGELQEHRAALEKVQNLQSEDSRSIARQQKNTERYLAKKQMLMGRKDECNRNIRDLGVLPEEAFEKYTNEKLDRVRVSATPDAWYLLINSLVLACQKASHSQRRFKEIRTCQQEGV